MRSLSTLVLATLALAGCTATSGTSMADRSLDPRFCYSGDQVFSEGDVHDGLVCSAPIVLDVQNPRPMVWRAAR